jgi:hypothetical protein
MEGGRDTTDPGAGKMDYVVVQFALKTVFVLLAAWALSRRWRLRSTHDSASGRLIWPVALVLVIIGLAGLALWQWDVDVGALFTYPARLAHSVEKKLSAPQRNPDGLYQEGRMVALGEGMSGSFESRSLSFQTLTHVHHIDFSEALDYRSWILACQMHGQDSAVSMGGGEIMRSMSDVRCIVVGRRPSS